LFLSSGGPYIGVSLRDVDPAESERSKIKGGALVDDVRADGPADKAGVKKGDIFVEFDGERVRSARHLSRLVEDTPAGRAVKATVLRDGRRTELSIAPSEQHGAAAFTGDQFHVLFDRFPPGFPFDGDVEWFSSRGKLGATVDELPEQLAQYFGATGGVLVASVIQDSPAARAGLRAGDVITKVGGMAVKSRSDLTQALRNVDSSGETTIEIVRDKKEASLTAKMDAPRRPIPPNHVRPA
jgi:serine protease Do